MNRLLIPLAEAAVLIAGCRSQPDVRKTYPVAGTLMINGAPAPAGIIMFLTPKFTETDKYPIHPRGLTGEGGAFKITTYTTDDGAPEGEYVATVEWPKPAVLSSYASGDQFGGAFAKADVNDGNPAFHVNVGKGAAKVSIDLAIAPEKLKAIEEANRKARQNSTGFNLNDR
jgi:hypothetical protein